MTHAGADTTPGGGTSGGDDVVEVASSACSLHEIDRGYAGLDMPPRDVPLLAAWRRAERDRLIAARLAVSADDRASRSASIGSQLDAVIGVERKAGTVVSLYWPFRGEPDLRPWMQSAFERGLRIALPLVVAKGQPLAFRAWQPGCVLARGVWNIPYPAEGAELMPEIVIAPLVGFDGDCFRLGYGGGFFDRTLAGYVTKPLTIGVGHPAGSLATIHPQPWDIPMDAICTGDTVTWRKGVAPV